MATKSAADRTIKDIINFDDIFHPLTKLDYRLFEQERKSFRENVQPVLINDAVYIQGSDSNFAAVIWKYSLSKKSWSPPITPPQDQKVPDYTLTEYQSQLLLIGKTYDQEGMLIIINKFDEDKGWLLVENVTTPPIDSMQSASELSAVSEERCLIISWVKGERFQLLVFDGLTWKEVDGPKCQNGYGRSNMIVHDGILYLSDCRHDSIYSVPLESLLLGDGNEKWKSLPDLPYKHMLYEGAANLTLLNSSILATLIPSYRMGASLVLALEPLTKSWIDLGEISCEVGHGISPRLVGLPPGSAGNTKLIAMGQIARVERRVPVGGQVFFPYATVRHNFAVLEISATVTKYNPNEKISLRALMIFEKCSSYKVLKELEKSQSKKETFMETAKCAISNKHTQIELYSDVKSSALCIESWLSSTAQYTLPPTWDNFLHIILPEIKLSDIAEEIEKYLSSTIEPNVDKHDFDEIEQKHLAAIQQAINRQGSLSHTTIHGVIVGLARSGKDCLMKRLLGEKPMHKSPSTGVAEKAFHVSIEKCPSSTISACVEDSRWIRLAKYDDEAIKMMNQITSTQQNVKEAPRPSQKSEINETIEISSEEVTSNSEDMNVLQSVVPAIQENTESDDIKQIPGPGPHSELPSHESPLEIFKTAIRSKGLQGLREHLKSHWSIYLSNTGGQMEFQELLPLLVSGPSMFFVTFRLDRDLNVRYQIEYETAVETSDDSPPKKFKYTSSSTPLETILQTLASIDAVGTYDYSHKYRKKCALKYKVFIIGTHRDVLDARIGNEEGVQLEIQKIDKTIHESVKSASYYRRIEFATEDQLIFTVNNFSKSDDDFKRIRSSVQRNVDSGAFVTTSPSHWLIYSLVLRQRNNQIESYSTCFKIAKVCGITDDEEHREALHFIHTKMGIIHYFELDGLNSMVILNPQILFARATKIITETFTFEQVGYHSTEDFKKGIFDFSEFERITRQKYPDSPLTPALFGDLLEHLHIAARFHVKGVFKYFFPCALSHACDSALQKQLSHGNPHAIPPLVISFECGYRPFGIAGALIAYLMNEGQSKELEWILLPEQIYRDQVSFCVEPSCDIIVLKMFPTHMEVKCLPESDDDRDDYPVQKTCTEVCRSIKAGIEKVNSDINYINLAEPIFTFYCQSAHGSLKPHPGRIVYSRKGDNVPRRLSCPLTMKPHQLPVGYENWQLQKLSACESADSTCTHLLSNRHTKPDIALPDAKRMKCDTRCDIAHHAELFSQLKVHAAKWRDIGTHLGFLQGEMDNIQSSPMNLTGAPQSYLSAMLALWLEWAPGDARGSAHYTTLEALKSAVSEASLGSTADSLKLSTP